MKTIAIIPARGGSKGIPNKNLRKIEGKSLVEWSIMHAQQSKKVDRILVSTDSVEIQEVALNAGAEAPFLRPRELAADDVLDLPVFEHTLDWLAMNESYAPDLVVHLRPTAPYRLPGWIDEAVSLLENNSTADAVRSVSEVTQHPFRVFEINDIGMLDPIMKHRHPHPALLRRQELPSMYFYNCVIDVTRASTIIKLKSMTGNNLLPWVMSADQVIDIDTPLDLSYAKWYMTNKGLK
jgi:CMP-N,N'-diacetyllegionaminic acid synthase